jgi:hypothetical protein
MVKPLTISEKLHLVIPIYGDDGETITAYVHSAPISREVFDAHYLLIAQTFSAIHAEGLGIIAGPRVASLLLHDVARKKRDEIGALALMNEIRRLSNVMVREATGWAPLPFQEVVDRKLISEDDLSEVANALVFFIVTSAMQRRADLKEMMDGAARLWGARTSSSDFTGFAASLATSKEHVSTTKAPVSSAVY